MKTLNLALSALILSLTLAAAQVTRETTVTTTTAANPPEAVGTLTSFDPGSGAIVVTPSGASPVTYRYDSTTTLVDEAGNPVSAEVISSGAPVTVTYTESDGRMTASKVVVRRAAPVMEQTTTTTTTHQE